MGECFCGFNFLCGAPCIGAFATASIPKDTALPDLNGKPSQLGIGLLQLCVVCVCACVRWHAMLVSWDWLARIVI